MMDFSKKTEKELFKMFFNLLKIARTFELDTLKPIMTAYQKRKMRAVEKEIDNRENTQNYMATVVAYLNKKYGVKNYYTRNGVVVWKSTTKNLDEWEKEIAYARTL